MMLRKIHGTAAIVACLFALFTLTTPTYGESPPIIELPEVAGLKTLALTNWVEPDQQNHPLTGKIWDKVNKRFISATQLLLHLNRTRYILLGETHDNADHHRLQANILRYLANNNHVFRAKNAVKRPALVMEMVRIPQMQKYERFKASKNVSAERLGQAIGWHKERWPDWKIYRPIGEVLLSKDLELYPGQPGMTTMRILIKKGTKFLPPKTIKQLQLDRPLPKPLQDGLLKTIKTAHCATLPADIIPSMADVQRYKDSFMADVMIEAARGVKDPQVVLIAGSGHTRTDWGVPYYLRTKHVKGKIVSIAFHEVNKDATKIAHVFPKGTPSYDLPSADFIIFTPNHARKDPCGG